MRVDPWRANYRVRAATIMSERASTSPAPPIKLSSPETHEFWEIPVVFEDEHLLALDKPAALLTSPDSDDARRPSLMRLLHDGIADAEVRIDQGGC